jgi:hypothetical protein
VSTLILFDNEDGHAALDDAFALQKMLTRTPSTVFVVLQNLADM